jgi:hypothetical protein
MPRRCIAFHSPMNRDIDSVDESFVGRRAEFAKQRGFAIAHRMQVYLAGVR